MKYDTKVFIVVVILIILIACFVTFVLKWDFGLSAIDEDGFAFYSLALMYALIRLIPLTNNLEDKAHD